MSSEPNRPHQNQEQVQALRLQKPSANQVPGQQQHTVRTIDDDVPRGTLWVPSEDDHKPLHKPKALEIPSFIPERLDRPVGDMQTALARSLRPDQNIQDTESKPKMNLSKPAADFDPDVDSPDDVFVGDAGLVTKPAAFHDAAGNPISQEEMRARAVKKSQQPQQPQQTQPNQRQREANQERLVEEHPVLQRLRERFGLKAQVTKSEDVGGMKFTFRKYTNQAYSKFVINQVRETSVETHAEFMTKLPYALAAIAIAAINDVPTHIVFATELDIDPVLEAPALARDPLHPPTSVIVKVAEILYPWLVGLSIPELGDTLATTYGKLFPEENLIQDKGLWRYSCPHKSGCNETTERLPRYDAEGNMRPVYCSIHGVPMRALGSLAELADIPLA